MPDTARLCQLLRHAPVFQGITDEDDLFLLVAGLRHRVLIAGERIFQQGERGDSMVIVVAGNLSVRVSDALGSEVTIQVLGLGEALGEMACIDPAPRSASVVAEGDAEIVELSRELLSSFQRRTPEVAVSVVHGIILHVARRLRDTDEFIRKVLAVLPNIEPDGGQPTRGTSVDEPGNLPEYLPSAPLDTPLPAFRRLDAEDLARLLELADVTSWPAGAVICREGEPGESCFMLLRGQVEVYRASSQGDRHLATLRPGTSVGQLSLVERTPRTATLKAGTEVLALEIRIEVFERLLSSASRLALGFQEHIAVAGIRQLRLANARLAGMFGKSVDLNQPEVFAACIMGDGAEAAWTLHCTRSALYEWSLDMDE